MDNNDGNAKQQNKKPEAAPPGGRPLEPIDSYTPPPTASANDRDERLLATIIAGYVAGRGSNVDYIAAAKFSVTMLDTLRKLRSGELKGQNV